MDMGRRIIELPIGGIVIDLGPPDPDNPGHFLGGGLASSLKDGEHEGTEAHFRYDAMIDGTEHLVLAHAVAGVDVTSPAYIEGLEVAMDTCMNAV